MQAFISFYLRAAWLHPIAELNSKEALKEGFISALQCIDIIERRVELPSDDCLRAIGQCVWSGRKEEVLSWGIR